MSSSKDIAPLAPLPSLDASRPNGWAAPHKGFRGVFAEALYKLSSCDWEDDAEMAAALDYLYSTVKIYDWHARGENDFFMPLLEGKGKDDVLAEWRAQHGAGREGASSDDTLLAHIEQLRAVADADERYMLGNSLYHEWARLVAHHIEHMYWEETVVNDAFLAVMTDNEYNAMMLNFVRTHGPKKEEMPWLGHVTPEFLAANSTKGRVELETNICNMMKQGGAPAVAIRGAVAAHQSRLSAAEKQKMVDAGFDVEKIIGGE